MTFGHAMHEDLTGVRWVATALVYEHGATEPIIPGSVIDLVFGPNDAISGSSGCNRYFGPWSLLGAMLELGPVATTRMACADAALADQEMAYTRTLERVTSFARDGDRLLLLGPAGNPLIEFSAAPLEP